MATMASHSAQPRDWPRMIRPIRAASTGLTLMKTPKKRAGTRRRANRSARKGTAEARMAAAAAEARARGGGGGVGGGEDGARGRVAEGPWGGRVAGERHDADRHVQQGGKDGGGRRPL